jgi:ribosomal protein S12 methylthiotransferase accessory factor YcaO
VLELALDLGVAFALQQVRAVDVRSVTNRSGKVCTCLRLGDTWGPHVLGDFGLQAALFIVGAATADGVAVIFGAEAVVARTIEEANQSRKFLVLTHGVSHNVRRPAVLTFSSLDLKVWRPIPGA